MGGRIWVDSRKPQGLSLHLRTAEHRVGTNACAGSRDVRRGQVDRARRRHPVGGDDRNASALRVGVSKSVLPANRPDQRREQSFDTPQAVLCERLLVDCLQ